MLLALARKLEKAYLNESFTRYFSLSSKIKYEVCKWLFFKLTRLCRHKKFKKLFEKAM